MISIIELYRKLVNSQIYSANHRLTSKGISAIPEIYSSPYYQDDMGYSYGYRPTTLASFAIEKSLLGESAIASHSVNLILYLITCLLIFFLLKRVFPDKTEMALFTALLFTVHPIHTEVVASIKNRDEILALLFMLLAFWSFYHSKTKNPLSWKIVVLLVGVLLIGLSLSSKLSTASLLVLLPLVLHQAFQRSIRIIVFVLVAFILDGVISQRANHSFAHPSLIIPLLIVIDIGISKTLRTNIISVISSSARKTKVMIQEKRMRFASFRRESLTRAARLLKLMLIRYIKSVFRFASRAIKLLWTFFFPPGVGKAVFRLPVEIPSVLIILLLYFVVGLKGVLVLLISWKLTKLLSRKLQVWILDNGIILMLVLAFSDFEGVIPFYLAIILPIILFKNYLNANQSRLKLASGFLLLFIGLILISINLFVFVPRGEGDNELVVDGAIFAIYCFTIVSTLAFRMTKYYSVRTNIIFQIGLSILSFWVGFSIIPQAGFTLAITQISPIINLLLIAASLWNFKISPRLKPVSLKLILNLLVFVFLVQKININYQKVVSDSMDATITAKTHINQLQHKYSESFNILLEDFTTAAQPILYEFKETWLIPIKQGWHETIANSTSPIKFDSQYVENTLKQIETIPANVGRPLDFTEYPISPFVTFPVKLGLAITNTSRLLVNLVVPLELSFYYGFNEIWVTNLLEAWTIVILLLLLGIFFTAIFLVFTGDSITGIALLMTLVCIVPFSGIIEPLPGIYAPRFTYTASFFFCVSISELICSWRLSFRSAKIIPRSILFFAIIILVSMGVFSANRNKDWKNKLTLMTKDIQSVPNSAQAHNLLAHALMENVFADNTFSNDELGYVKQAAQHFTQATDIYPFFFNAWVDLARVSDLVGDENLALDANIQAFNIDSTYPPVISSIAKAYEASGDVKNAIIYNRKHVKVAPNDFLGYDNLARILYQQGRLEESRDVCLKYLKIDPNNASFTNNLKVIESALNKPNE